MPALRPQPGFRFAAALAIALSAAPLHALTLYGADDKANTGKPDNGSPWQAVGTFTNQKGTTIGASCVYLGHGYVLTANHVGVSGWVSFGGATYPRDASFAPAQIAPGVDAKVLRLASFPEKLPGVTLYAGDQERHAKVTQIGWGVGRDPADARVGPGPLTLRWGRGRGKRWGTNTVDALLPHQRVANYVFDALGVALSATDGAHEAGFADGDSGSAMFAFLDKKWQLIGLNTAVSTHGASTFGGPAPDTNLAVRISAYRDKINALMAGKTDRPPPASGQKLRPKP